MTACKTLIFTGMVLLILSTTLEVASSFTIGAFNIQVFGQSKISKPEVVKVLVKILQRYDIVLIQEIRDSSGTAIETLLKEVNKVGPHTYQMIISERLGRTTSKEQYAYFYRMDSEITLLDSYQDEDVHDIFEREPFAAYFQSSRTDAGKFALVGVHTAPESAAKEIDALKIVLEDVYTHWNEENILILGDLNADCSYFNKGQKEQSSLRTPDYHWLIPDEADTTVSATDCAYDRFIMDSKSFVQKVILGSIKVFHFDKEYGLTEEEAKAVSDHYPIELELSGDVRGAPAEPPSSSHTAAGGGGFFDGVWDFLSRARKRLEL